MIENPKYLEELKDQKFAINWLTLLAVKNLKEVTKLKDAFDSIETDDPFEQNHKIHEWIFQIVEM